MSDKQIQERVLELVASVEQYAKLTRHAAADYAKDTVDLAIITAGLATELATLLGKGRLEVSRES